MKFSGGERRAKGPVRLHRARGSEELKKVACGSAMQGLWLRNGRVRSQGSGIDRSRFPEIRTVGEVRRGRRRASEKESIMFSGLIWVKEKSKSSAMPQPWPWR